MDKIEESISQSDENKSNEEDKVLKSFWLAIEQTGIKISREYISDMVGWPIRMAIETICNKVMPYAKEKEIKKKVEEIYSLFSITLEHQYQS
jgi:hypothetical protein